MKKRFTKKRRNQKAPARKEPNLSLTWFTEDQVYQNYSTSKDCLRKWRDLGLPISQPSGRVYIYETDMQNFLISFRRVDLKE